MTTIVDPVTSAFWLSGVKDTEYRHLRLGGPFGLRGASNVLVQDGDVGGTEQAPLKSPGCLIGGVQDGARSSNVTVRGVRLHDIVPPNVGDHHEALYISCADYVELLDLVIERVFANTADIFFTGWETSGGPASHVHVAGCLLRRPTNGKGNDAIQWNDVNGPLHDYLIEGCLFDGSQMNFGTITKPVSNFVVGVNYGDTPTQAQLDHARRLGVQFLELPFRPAADWPGTSAPPPVVVAPPPPPPPPPTATATATAPARVTVTEAGVSGSKLQAALAAHGSPITLTSAGKPIATVTKA